MNERTVELVLATGLIGIALNLAIYLYLRHIASQDRRLLDQSNPQFPDWAQSFNELQHRIDSEARLTRRKVDSAEDSLSAKLDNSTATFTKMIQIVAQVVRDEITTVLARIADDGELTRQRVAQVKTRLTDDEKDDQKAKAKARRGTRKTVKPKGSK